MNRREFMTLLGGAAAWPLVAHAQQRERVRRVGVLNGAALESDPAARSLANLHEGTCLMGYPHNYGLNPSPCKRLPVRGSRACADVPRRRGHGRGR